MIIYDQGKTIFDNILEDSTHKPSVYGYVYITKNIINNKQYIGKSTKPFSNSYLGSGKHIQQAVKKYKKENFIVNILEICYSKDHLDQQEIYWINFYNAKYSNDFYNILDTITPIFKGEENGFYGKKHTEETKLKVKQTKNSKSQQEKNEFSKKISIGLKKFYQTDDGKKLIEKIKQTNTNKKHTQKTIEQRKTSTKNRSQEEKEKSSKKLSNSLRKFYDSENGIKLKEKQSKTRKGKFVSKETKKRISDSLKGKPKPWTILTNKNPEKIRKTAEKHRGMKRSLETRKNISLAKKGKSAPNKNEIWYHDPINKITKSFFPNENIPENFIKGKGMKFFYDPITLQNIFCWESEKPIGWLKGRKPRKE